MTRPGTTAEPQTVIRYSTPQIQGHFLKTLKGGWHYRKRQTRANETSGSPMSLAVKHLHRLVVPGKRCSDADGPATRLAGVAACVFITFCGVLRKAVSHWLLPSK